MNDQSERLNPRRFYLHAVSIAALFVVLLSVSTGTARTAEVLPFHQNHELQQKVAAEWGIEILSLRSTAANYMLDFRYRVIDAEKAKPIFDRKTKPYLVDQASGHKFAVPNPPKTGPLRNSNTPQVDRNYFTIFANPGKYIQPGSMVTVVIGDFRAENLVVQ
ncbi:MAG: hypothetical protein C0619_10415 [Desulfuromonas sp.]|nr:MAG: hypothetical protein C0619_10415 [Desulfuromonas sp.]